MIVLIDSNIVLDQMLKNENFYEDAEDIIALSEVGVINGYVSASAVTDIYYIARKAYQNKVMALKLIRVLLLLRRLNVALNWRTSLASC